MNSSETAKIVFEQSQQKGAFEIIALNQTMSETGTQIQGASIPETRTHTGPSRMNARCVEGR